MEFTDVVAGREAVRKFDGRKPTDEQLAQILEAGRLAPTAYNKQPQRVYVLESDEALGKMDAVHPCRYGAPVVLLVCGDRAVTPTSTASPRLWSTRPSRLRICCWPRTTPGWIRYGPACSKSRRPKRSSDCRTA